MTDILQRPKVMQWLKEILFNICMGAGKGVSLDLCPTPLIKINSR